MSRQQHSSSPFKSPTRHLSDERILELNTYDFMAHLGKRVINPGGSEGLDKILAAIQPKASSHILELGCGNGHAACYIASRYGCRVTAVDIAPDMIDLANRTVMRRGLSGQVQCTVGNVTDLEFADASFDYVIAQAVLMFVDQGHAIREICRVLKPGGQFAGLEFGWKKPPPDEVRDKTYHICGCRTLEFHSGPDWARRLADNGIHQVDAAEHTFNLLSVRGFLRDEGLGNSLRIGARVMSRKANRVRMGEIWTHFSRNVDYFNYVVMAGRKAVESGDT